MRTQDPVVEGLTLQLRFEEHSVLPRQPRSEAGVPWGQTGTCCPGEKLPNLGLKVAVEVLQGRGRDHRAVSRIESTSLPGDFLSPPTAV